VLLAASFFDPPGWKIMVALATEAAFTVTAVVLLAAEVRPRLERFRRWYDAGSPDPADTIEVWSLVVNGSAETYRRWAARTIVLSLLPVLLVSTTLWHIGWQGLVALVLASVVPVYYATSLSYSISELLTRPMAEDIAARAGSVAVYQSGTSLVRRLRIAVPAYTTAAATLTVGLLGVAHAPRALAVTTLTAVAVGYALAVELTALLSDAVTAPLQRVQHQLAAVSQGNFDKRIPVLTSDEFGELANAVNTMTAGLAERQVMSDTIGTYLDRSIGDLIVSGKIPLDGFDATASIMFCDIRGYTSWAAQRSAREVVAALNEVFSTIVPIVTEHGGHVDKFLGDGLLAVFGVPVASPDHADRAVEAAVAIAAAGRKSATGLRLALASAQDASSPVPWAAPADSTSVSSVTRSTSPPASRRRPGTPVMMS